MPNASAKELLANALKRRYELRIESEALDSFIRTYQALLAYVPVEENSSDQLNLWKGQSRRALKSAQVGKMLDEAKRLILEEKRPMKRSDLVRRLEERGFEIIGRDKSKVFGTNIWRSGLFHHIDGVGYWPKDVEIPREFDSRSR